jgi:hypothetical protein
MCAMDIQGEHQPIRLFGEELHRYLEAPFDTSDRACMAAYSSAAEAACFAVLGWRLPQNIIDPYGEHLLDLNGRRRGSDTSLIAALHRHGLPAMSAEHKDAMRGKVMFQNTWDTEERAAILDYCMEDNVTCAALLRTMDAKGLINWEQALWRGRYLALSGGHIEHHGIPIDVSLYQRLREEFPRLRHSLIEHHDEFRVYVHDHLNQARVAALIGKLPWPRNENGHLRMDGQTWKEMAIRYPRLESLSRLMGLLDQLRHTELRIGADGRNRFWSRPLLSRTGRNQPSTSENIFGNAKWWRGLITPPPGFAIVLIDWSGQENAIAAGLSRDGPMRRAYETGDIHMATAILCKQAPEGATADTHPRERNMIKPITHGSNYGISPFGVARRLNAPLSTGRRLLHAYDREHWRFRQWQEEMLLRAYLTHRIAAPMGWSMYVDQRVGHRTLLNWPMQSTGGEMLRAAVVMLVRAGFTICATAHDAIMLLMPFDRLLDERVTAAQEIMERVSVSFTDGIVVRTKPHVVRPGERLLDGETRPMWERVMAVIGDAEPLPPLRRPPQPQQTRSSYQKFS